MAVARQRELSLEFGLVEALFHLEVKGGASQKTRRCQAVQRCGGRHQHHVGTVVAVMLADAPQRGQALADQVLVRREGVIWQGFPVGEQHTTQIGRKKCHFVDQPLCIRGIGGDDGGDLALCLVAQGQLCQQQGIGRAHRSGQGVAFTGVEFG
jgi:hypothetical protein